MRFGLYYSCMIPDDANTNEGLLDLLGDLANCRLKSGFENDILPKICDVLNAASGVMHYYSGDGQEGLYYDPIYVKLDAKYIKRFRDEYSHLDPFPKAALRKCTDGEGYAFGSDQLVDMEAFAESEFYSYFLKPQGIYHMLVIVIMRSSKPFAFVGFHRNKEQRAFSTDEIELANRLAPHLSAAADRVYMAQEMALYKRAMDTLSYGLMNKGLLVLDENLSLVFANDYARKAFASREEFNTELRYVPKQIVEASETLLAQGILLSNMASANFVLEKREPRIEGYVRVNAAADGSQLFLAFFNSDEFGGLNPRVCKAFGLTKREIEITQCVVEGKTNSEVAEELFISVRTVQNHLRSIYEKCEVNNRTSLSNKVLSLI